MKISFPIFVFLFATFVFVESGYGCTCVIYSLSENFRKSKAIFVGRLADFENVPNSNIQNFDEGRPVFEVTKPLKGISKKYVAINLDWYEIGQAGMCPTLINFDEDEDYLIFAYGKELTIQSVCPDSRKLKSQSTDRDRITAREIQKLESFWFRTKARLWPF